MIKSGTFRKYRSIFCSREKLLETLIVWSIVFLCACVLYLENAHLLAQRTTYRNYTKFLDDHERHNFSNMTEEISYESAGEFFENPVFYLHSFFSAFVFVYGKN